MTVAARDRVRIAVWSDYVCPFCYLELPVLERLRDQYAGRLARAAGERGAAVRADPGCA